MWKAECGMRCDVIFVKNPACAMLVMNDWRAADCKHTCTVEWWRIASSFVFTQGHSEARGRWSKVRGERDAAGLNGESEACLCCPFLFFFCPVPRGLICYWLAAWTPGPELRLEGCSSRLSLSKVAKVYTCMFTEFVWTDTYRSTEILSKMCTTLTAERKNING